MLTFLIISNCVLNVFFGLTCGLICFQVFKNKKQQVKVKKPDYKR